MKKAISFVVIALFFGTGCNDRGVQTEDGEVDVFLNRFTDTLTVNINQNIGGSVSRSPDQAKYLPGTAVTLTARADSGYAFIEWSGASASTDPTITVTMDGKKTLAAKFLPTYALAVSANPASGGSVSRNPSKNIYIYGDTVIVTATANSGYEFLGWSGASESMDDTIIIIMDSHKELTANFLHKPFDLSGPAAWREAVDVIKNDGDNKVYIINVSSDIVVSGGAAFGSAKGITVTLEGSAAVTLSERSSGSILKIGEGQTVILKDATLKGHDGNNAPLVYVDGGTFIMDGGTISGNTNADNGGGVYVYSGTFTMNEGRISGNTANSGGGVYVYGGTFAMGYGAIWGNTAYSYGGGVYVGTGAIFAKTGGVINGYDGDSTNGNVVKNYGTVRSNGGHAVYAGSGDNNKRKETSAVLNMDLHYNGVTGEFSGNWDY